jgi:transmembrane sensor
METCMTHHTTNKPILELLDRYLAGELTSAEAAEFELLFQRDPLLAQDLDDIRQRQGGARYHASRADRVWQLIEQKRGASNLSQALDAPHLTSPPPRQRLGENYNGGRMVGGLRQRVVWLAAAAVVMLLAPFAWDRVVSRPTIQTATQIYHTGRGQRTTVTFPDGSVVTLAPESELSFSQTDDGRRVTMQGRAYFRIDSDNKSPFVVVAGETETRVLGTEFDVSAYPGSPPHIAVFSGKVAVKGRDETREILTAGQAVIFEPTHVAHREARDADFSWTTGILAFQDAPAHIVAEEIRRYYDLQIRFASEELAKRRVTITVHDQPARELLEILALALNVRYEQSGNAVLFK